MTFKDKFYLGRMSVGEKIQYENCNLSFKLRSLICFVELSPEILFSHRTTFEVTYYLRAEEPAFSVNERALGIYIFFILNACLLGKAVKKQRSEG